MKVHTIQCVRVWCALVGCFQLFWGDVCAQVASAKWMCTVYVFARYIESNRYFMFLFIQTYARHTNHLCYTDVYDVYVCQMNAREPFYAYSLS